MEKKVMKTKKLKKKIENDESRGNLNNIFQNETDNKDLHEPKSGPSEKDKKIPQNNNIDCSLNDISKKAKVVFIPEENLFALFCVACDCRFKDVPPFLDHICTKKKKYKIRKIKEIKKPEESIGTESNLIIGEDGLWHCRICDKGYDKKNSLKKHEQAHLRTYTCEICGKGLKSSVNLREHMNIHSGAKPYKCHLCPMGFARKWGLTSHVRSHIGDKRYTCQYCEKKFINGAILKIHIRMVHTKEKPCQCELCGQHFYSNQLLKEHKKRHLNIRPYKCEYENCGKSFYDRKQLNRHYVSHSNEKPFECTFNNCNAKFARQKTLQAHLKIHTGVKDYVCSICGKAFAMNYNLTSHMKTHANGKVKGKRNASVIKQETVINSDKNLTIINQDLLNIKKEETDNIIQNNVNKLPSNNERIISVVQNFDSNFMNQSLNNTPQNHDKIELNVEQEHIQYPDDDKSLVVIYNNATNSVPLNNPLTISVENKFNDLSSNQGIINDNIIPILFPQTVIVTGSETTTVGATAGDFGTNSSNVSQILTVDQLTFNGNNMIQIYQIPN